jgi:uncharacterized OB-fold protein
MNLKNRRTTVAMEALKNGYAETHGTTNSLVINYCPTCGIKITAEMNYCPKCGRELR